MMNVALLQIAAGAVFLGGGSYILGRGVGMWPGAIIMGTAGIFLLGDGILALLHPETWRIAP